MPVIDIDRDAAREAAQRELDKPLYPDQSPTQHVLDLIERLLDQVVVKAAAVPGGWFTISLLLIGAAAAVVAGVRIARRTLRTGRPDQPLFGPAELSAAEYRAAAKRCAASGDWADAIRHRLRAVASELEHRGVLHPVPGRTANELAHDAGAALPQLADEFIGAACVFNDVSYGELPATAAGYRVITDIDEQLETIAVPIGLR